MEQTEADDLLGRKRSKQVDSACANHKRFVVSFHTNQFHPHLLFLSLQKPNTSPIMIHGVPFLAFRNVCYHSYYFQCLILPSRSPLAIRKSSAPSNAANIFSRTSKSPGLTIKPTEFSIQLSIITAPIQQKHSMLREAVRVPKSIPDCGAEY